MERFFLILASINGFLAVALGAFGAHGLKTRLADLPDLTQRLDWWQTAAHYHLGHALALGLMAYLAGRNPGALTTAGGWFLIAGIVLFSGSLYAMTLTGVKALGAITPLGGICLLAGWALAAAAAWRLA